MTKNEFIKKLKSKLYFNFSHSEIQKIIGDYEEYFSVGLAEGKSEAALATEFGEPSLIVAEILSERNENSKGIKFKIIAVGAILLLTFAFFFLFSKNFTAISELLNNNDILGSLWFIILLPTVIFFILGGKSLFRRAVKKQKLAVLYSVNLAVLVGFSYLLYTILAPNLLRFLKQDLSSPYGVFKLFGLNDPSKWGPFTYNICLFIAFIVLVFFFVAAIYAVKQNPFAIPLLYVNSAAALGVFYVIRILSSLSDPLFYNAVLIKMIWSLLGGFSVAMLIVAVIFIVEGGIKRDCSNEKRSA